MDERLGAVLTDIRERFGDIEALEPLTEGQSGAFVARICFHYMSCILKLAKSAREYAFYTQVAPLLSSHGITVPHLLSTMDDTAGAWLILEDVSQPLPRSRWLADPEMLTVLRRLHSLTPEFPIPHPFEPRWTPEMTDIFSQRLPDRFTPILHTLRERHTTLFDRQCVISGDPNPTNWGLRADGTLALFDWERVGYGIPAIDLAITVPGLGATEEYRRVAQAYLCNLPEAAPEEVEHLAHAVAIAKVWTVIEYVTTPAESEKHLDRITVLLDSVPSWLHAIYARDVEFHRAIAPGNA